MSIEQAPPTSSTDSRRGFSYTFYIIIFLFEDLRHRPANPYLRLLQGKDIGHSGRHVILHHAFLELTPCLDTLAGNDEGRLHLLHGDAAVTFVDAAVVGGDRGVVPLPSNGGRPHAFNC